MGGRGRLVSDTENTWIWLCLTCNRSTVSKTRPPQTTYMALHHQNNCRKRLLENRNLGIHRSENPNFPNIWGWGRYWVTQQAFGFSGIAQSRWTSTGPFTCGSCFYSSCTVISTVCPNRHWEFSTGTDICFVSLSGTEDGGSNDRLGCRASYCVFRPNGAALLH